MFERGDIIVSYSPATSCALRRLNQCQLRVHLILFAAELEAHFDAAIAQRKVWPVRRLDSEAITVAFARSASTCWAKPFNASFPTS